jgi:ABC-2 type transport system ATP-binding protein
MVPAIEVDGVRKRYGDVVAVDDVSIRVQPGEVLGILGRNGAGKTTLVETIAGMRRPDRGVVRVLGLDPWRQRSRVRQVLGVQLQQPAMHGQLTVTELARLHRSFHRDGADAQHLVERLGLGPHRGQRFERLSGGQQQRMSIALALIGDPRVAILDELTTGLDPTARRDTWRFVESLRDRGVTVVLVSHVTEEAQRLCDRVAIIDRGRVVALDSPAGLIARTGFSRRVRLRTDHVVDPAVLTDLPGVEAVDVSGQRVAVTGAGDLLRHVSEALATHRIVVTDAQLEQATLDDAFVALTGSGRDGEASADRSTAQRAER